LTILIIPFCKYSNNIFDDIAVTYIFAKWMLYYVFIKAT